MIEKGQPGSVMCAYNRINGDYACQNKHLLTYPNAVERLLKLELELAKDPSTAATAGHLQVTARKKG